MKIDSAKAAGPPAKMDSQPAAGNVSNFPGLLACGRAGFANLSHVAMERSKIWPVILVIVVTAVGAFFRLFHLGAPAFRADTIEFWRICHTADLSAVAIFRHWLEIVGRTAQFPLPMALTKGFLDLFGLPPSDFCIRLPLALSGILTVPAVYLAGRQLSGWRFGIFAAALLALNPYHIQLSREAYYYSPLLLGAALMLWSANWAYNHRKLRRNFPLRFFIVTAVGFLFMTYSHLSGWWMAAVLVPFSLAAVAWRARAIRGHGNDLIALLAIYIVIGLPLTFVSWGIPYFVYDYLHPEIKEYVIRHGGGTLPPIGDMIVRVVGRMTFGTNVWRGWFDAAAIAFAFMAGMAAWLKRRRWPLMIAGSIVIVELLYYAGVLITATPFGVRHQSIILVSLLMFLAYGIWHFGLPRRFAARQKPERRRLAAWLIAVFALALNAWPAVLSTQLTGKPTPYKDIAGFCDRSLPPGILVLVDRWFEPWNELRVYNSTNVFFAFTVPDEPPDTYEKNRWRETALDFFNRFPDAAYLELSRASRDLRGIVSSVPFARNVAFTNLAAIRLRDLGLAYREDCYARQDNRLIIDLFYNTRADVIDWARRDGRKVMALYGPGWGYTKLWQQTGDFRDWRLMQNAAALDIYNLTSAPLKTDLIIRGMAVNGSKRVSLAGRNIFHDFAGLRLDEWRLPNLNLAQGLTRIEFDDQMWNAARIPLFVDLIRVVETPALAPPPE